MTLKLTRRDDPLAIGDAPESTPAESEQPVTAAPAAAPDGDIAVNDPGAQATPAPVDALESGDGETGERGVIAVSMGDRGPYDDDRLVQTGWRMYESLVDEVAALNEALKAEGFAASRASLVAAVLHRHLPRDLHEADALLRDLRQASAGRAGGR